MAKKKISRETDVVLRAATLLWRGKRLEVVAKGGKLIIYMGSTTANRRDPFWYEHSGGRTYKETPEEVLRAVLPHVGFEPIENARVSNE